MIVRHFVRYAFVGVIATAAHYIVLAVLVEWAGWPAWLASGFGAAVGAQVAFVGNRWFTFEHAGPWLPAWTKFQGTAIFSAGVGMVIVAAGVALGVHYILAQVIATLTGLLLTFTINRHWTFR